MLLSVGRRGTSADLDLTYVTPIRAVVPPDPTTDNMRGACAALGHAAISSAARQRSPLTHAGSVARHTDMRFLFRTLVSGVKSISYEIMRGGGSIAAPALAAPAPPAPAGAPAPPAGGAPSVPGTHGLGPVQSFTCVAWRASARDHRRC